MKPDFVSSAVSAVCVAVVLLVATTFRLNSAVTTLHTQVSTLKDDHRKLTAASELLQREYNFISARLARLETLNGPPVPVQPGF